MVATLPEPRTAEAVRCAVCGSLDSVGVRARTRQSSWVVCRDCGLVFQSPRVAADAIADAYLEGDYHRRRGGVPEHYVRYSLRRSRACLAWALERSGVQPAHGRAYDIGCGVGGALCTLREAGFRVAGIEPDPELSALARDRFGLDVRTGLFGPDCGAPGDVAFAYSCHVWEHLADPVATARTAHTLLADRLGWLSIVVPTYRHARSLAWQYMNADHTYLYSHTSLANVLESAGFEVVAHTYRQAADSELWMLARAVGNDAVAYGWHPEPVGSVQRAIAAVPLRAPLGIPGRVLSHARTLSSDPGDFAARAARAVRRRLHRERAV